MQVVISAMENTKVEISEIIDFFQMYGGDGGES